MRWKRIKTLCFPSLDISTDGFQKTCIGVSNFEVPCSVTFIKLLTPLLQRKLVPRCFCWYFSQTSSEFTDFALKSNSRESHYEPFKKKKKIFTHYFKSAHETSIFRWNEDLLCSNTVAFVILCNVKSMQLAAKLKKSPKCCRCLDKNLFGKKLFCSLHT